MGKNDTVTFLNTWNSKTNVIYTVLLVVPTKINENNNNWEEKGCILQTTFTYTVIFVTKII